MKLYGGKLLQSVAGRIIDAYLRSDGATTMLVTSDSDPLRASGVDLVYNRAGRAVSCKVKPDAYFGTDPRKIADQQLVFYRCLANSYAFETISHHLTREPGWMFNSNADELFYYFLALGQTEDEIGALMDEPDEVFFSELAVERDELHILPLEPLRDWFEANFERYTPRPVTLGDHSGWYRIIPISDIDPTVRDAAVRGPIFSRLIPR
ncbi:MAG: hypothetical protein Q7W30_07100 [Coriobacteriia bacterium]|nr:hypothetical protein [Coriobacteriia bacterium]